MFSCFFFLLYMAGSVLNHGAGSSILNRSPLFPRFFEDSVLGSRWGGVRKASPVWRQVATDRGSELSAAKSVRGSRCGGSYEKSVPLRILGCGQCRYVKSVASKNS
jgi:hypothetical protein